MNILYFFGKFHPLLVHLPIGILLFSVFLWFLALLKKTFSLVPVIRLGLGASAVSSLFSVATGFLLRANESYPDEIINPHMFMGIALTFLLFFIFKISKRLYKYPAGRKILSFLFILSAIFLIITGHFGGMLTHGASFLVPPPIQEWFGTKETESFVLNENTTVYEAVQYVFNSKCLSCHGPVRQRGGLRMDDYAQLIKGGKHGEVVLAGNPQESEILQRILLPLNDEYHMPPRERPQLTDEEIKLMLWWIEDGLKPDENIYKSTLPAELITLIETMARPEEEIINENYLPDYQVPFADASIIKEFEELNVVVVPLSVNQPWLSVSLVVTRQEDIHSVLEKLVSLKDQLIELKIQDRILKTEDLMYIGKLESLRRLYLTNCTLNAETSLQHISHLSALRYLNLSHNQLEKDNILPFSGHSALKNLYLYNNNINAEGAKALEKLLPETKILATGFDVPTFTSDTTELTP
ncbi:MAG: hypothetical protein JJU28_13285 [Cyclobacteriaceae bacterium]|nr:hypothetical protein [Cyclobacteriaceae bacterium]